MGDKQIGDLTDEELVQEIENTVRHLQNCRIDGQVDCQQMKLLDALKSEFLRRTSGRTDVT